MFQRPGEVRENRGQQVVKRVEWVAHDRASKSGVCPICESLDGQLRAMGKPFRTEDDLLLHEPPAHPNCRCTLAEVSVVRSLPRAASNPCHDPDTGQFCDTRSGPGGGLAEEDESDPQART